MSGTRVKCPDCGAPLWARPETDGNGRLVDVVDRCKCQNAVRLSALTVPQLRELLKTAIAREKKQKIEAKQRAKAEAKAAKKKAKLDALDAWQKERDQLRREKEAKVAEARAALDEAKRRLAEILGRKAKVSAQPKPKVEKAEKSTRGRRVDWDARAHEFRQLRADKKSFTEIAHHFGVTPERARQIGKRLGA